MTGVEDGGTDRGGVLARAVCAWSAVPAPGPWAEDAACSRLGFPAADVFTADRPDHDELAAAVTCLPALPGGRRLRFLRRRDRGAWPVGRALAAGRG